MASASLRPSRRPWLWAGVGVLAALAGLIAVFDWDWARPGLERYLSRHSGREVRAAHMAVTGLLSLHPTVTFERAYVENAPWADTRDPMATAGEASFTFPLRSLYSDDVVITRIVLKDASVDMERQADGLRNWRLRDPEDRGAPKVRILGIEAHRTTLRFANRDPERPFDIRFASSDAAPSDGAPGPLTSRIAVQGEYRGGPFTADVLTGPVVTFRRTGEFFPVRGQAISGQTRIEFEGRAADMFERPLLDGFVRVAGDSLEHLHPFILMRPAHSRPYALEGRVRRTGEEYVVSELRGRIGKTDLAGNASHGLRDNRHQWRADLRSDSADLHDLGTLAGIPYPGGNGAARLNKFFPQRPIKVERLRGVDAWVNLEARKVATPGMQPVEGLKFQAQLQQGVLEVKSLDVGLAGGHAAGEAILDARNPVPHGRASLKLAGVRLERLLPKLPDGARTGPMRGVLELEGDGASIAAMLGDASGKLDLVVDGGRISNSLDAKLSLNLGKIAGLFLKGDHDIPIYCALAGVDFNAGKGKVRSLMLETAQTRIEGAGAVSLRDERQDLVLVPHPKQPGLLTLGASIRVGGTFKHPDIELHKGASDAPPVASNAHCPARPVG